MECEDYISLEVSFWIQVVFGAFGFFGTLSMIVVFIKYSELRTYSNKLIFNLAISQTLSSITNFIPMSLMKDDFVCLGIGIAFNSLQLVSIIWAFALVCTLYLLIGKPAGVYKKNYKYWLAFSWIIVPLCYLLPLSTNSYSTPEKSFNNTCTFKNDPISQVWRFSLFFIPAWAFIIISFVLYYKVYKKLIQLRLQGESKEFVGRLFYYPTILIAFLIPLSLIRVISLFSKNCISHTVLQVLGWIISIQGLFDAIIFFGTPSVKTCIRKTNKYPGRISDGYYMSDYTSSIISVGA